MTPAERSQIINLLGLGARAGYCASWVWTMLPRILTGPLNATAQNEAMIATTVENGQRNMAALEQSVIKDNTLMSGEWYGGQLHVAPPTDQAGAQKSYTIVITVGTDRHVIDVAQGPTGA